jgi:predicted pyridoxine 5'-phosphate oxidase superfamily flavin-nucleotide-binding protein
MTTITSLEQLDQIYGKPGARSLVKEVDHLTPHYRAFIGASPFCVLGTSGPEGLDCSPRGDRPGFVRIADERTLLLPDRRGNDRTDP